MNLHVLEHWVCQSWFPSSPVQEAELVMPRAGRVNVKPKSVRFPMTTTRQVGIPGQGMVTPIPPVLRAATGVAICDRLKTCP